MIQWVSPLAETDYAEYRDEAFLLALGLGRLTESLVGNYWPRGGPCWDALATVTSPGDPHFRGAILVEAKSHTPEVYGTGCLAGEPSLTRIRKAWYDGRGARRHCQAAVVAGQLILHFAGLSRTVARAALLIFERSEALL